MDQAFPDQVRLVDLFDGSLLFSHRGREGLQAHGLAAVVKQYIEWGAGPRASQYMIVAAKCHAAINGKYAPDIEDVKAVATPILRHRIVKNYKAEAEGMSVDQIIASIL